ncbi:MULTISPECIES: protein-disulfide reductase DsbD [unclassified Undibacterium]|uniref:protein-disulfide reductase DsbD n=1 Tax=unclassified Undibacterium TaxID=2630295 RepID=UPI002AC940FA|nr:MULTISPECIES: protein-disulfide reductase DsbD [unclassified Undibacterium]MEB0137517.1 protein-disulfide reductase DsbD [Undibacterium sp. CCC2.1]MEB0170818.1 protein-disulfide reductase DsbD [Undibacterium sp. CCC1.1]MEB0174770.1 protein-disulfide reductase DsbD [Undibacterium sp. CCC3.4]MEB0214106.1 protein-disulfide reductase DsbD [Undibacterium sp. 5I2]WPX44422.1 protein-disulfide reductase DsbD [Undibacterium sp. CCC3.4]
MTQLRNAASSYAQQTLLPLLTYLAWAFCLGLASFAHADDFLDPEVAFTAEAKMLTPSMAEVTLHIADGYYLYRERLKFTSDDAQLGAPELPKGKIKFDETFQKEVETYRHSLIVHVPVQAGGEFTLKVGRQGCADQGLCYPPMESVHKLLPPSLPAATAAAVDSPESGAGTAAAPADEAGSLSSALKSGKMLVILPLFFLLGLGLSLTPCVLPMVPILSFIIVGEGAGISRVRGFVLSIAYVLGMALVYTGIGVAAGLAGEGLAASLQNPWVLSAFALLMVGLALSMFNVYQLQMPAALQTRLTLVSEGQRNSKFGKLFGVFLMGAISALIVGPCVTGPLLGALVYISQTRDVVVGAAAMFAIALGMGVPLLILGLSAGSLLPRAGVWMESIKRFFGVLMLAMALWMISPVIPVAAQMAAWAVILLGYAGYQLFFHRAGKPAKAFAFALGLLGLAQLVGVLSGGRDVISPLAHLYGAAPHTTHFQRIRSVAELDAALAQNKGKLAMLDFYADWCVSCKEMEKLSFSDERVKARMDTMLLLQADVTANNAEDKALLKRFGLFGPPGIIFFDPATMTEIPDSRVVGYQNAPIFLQSLQKLDAR